MRRLAGPALALLLGCSSPAAAPAPHHDAGAGSTRADPAPCKDPVFPGSPLGVRCGKLVDAEGRVVTLRGINARINGVFDVSFDDGHAPLMALADFTAEDAAGIRDFGFDSLRLAINWSGVEPTMDGGFDEGYLDRVAEVVSLCDAAGVLVIIDLHQDAYSKWCGGDGAPLWAIDPAPKMLHGPTDGSNPVLGKDSLAAFDTFFGTSAKGAELRGRFIAMAKHVTARFADSKAVLGLEIFNEPPLTGDALLALYQPALAAFREVSPDKLFLFEPSGLRNVFDKASLGNGSLGEGTAYAPHVYTFVFSGAPSDTMTKEDLRPSNASAADEAASWAAPLVITEWGYGPDGIKAADFFTWQSELQEEYQASSFLWLWKELPPSTWGCFDFDATGKATERPAMKKNLARVRPARVAGWPKEYAFDRASGSFHLEFTSSPSVTAPHLIAVAKVLGEPTKVTCDGEKAPVEKADEYGTLAVTCGQGDGKAHRIEVAVAGLP